MRVLGDRPQSRVHLSRLRVFPFRHLKRTQGEGGEKTPHEQRDEYDLILV